MSKNQVIKFEQNLCNADINDNSVLFVRVSDAVTDKKAIIEVPFTHNAILIKGGSDFKFLKSGNYPVFESKFFGDVKDWKKGLSVEVIYIPKDTSVLIYWGTPTQIRYRDSASNKVISVGARGQFGINISNPEQFYRVVVGARKEFDLQDFQKRFSAAVVNEFADCFLKVVDSEYLTYDQFDMNRKAIGEKVGDLLADKFDKSWGIRLVDFIIEAFKISDEDIKAMEDAVSEPAKKERIKEYLKEIERLDDKQWEREKYLKELEIKDREAYYEVLKITGKTSLDVEGKTASVFCPKCGNRCEAGTMFCPKCGTKIVVAEKKCPNCGKTNAESAAFCVYCGTKL